MKRLFLLVVVVTIVGCVQGGMLKNTNLQHVNSNNSAEIFVARSQQFVGGGIRHGITVDGWPIANIYPSQYIHTLIPIGLRSVAVEGQASLTLNFSQGEKYFFITYMAATNFGIVIERKNARDFYEMVNAKNNQGENLFKDVSANIITE